MVQNCSKTFKCQIISFKIISSDSIQSAIKSLIVGAHPQVSSLSTLVVGPKFNLILKISDSVPRREYAGYF
jgi:hypothetical protein